MQIEINRLREIVNRYAKFHKSIEVQLFKEYLLNFIDGCESEFFKTIEKELKELENEK